MLYDEKPICGRCGTTITGVVSSTKNGKPLCRDCAYELGERARHRKKSPPVKEQNPIWERREKTRRRAALALIGLVVAVFFLRAVTVAPLFKPRQPLRDGTYDTDRKTDECIENLWELSRRLQGNTLPDTLPSCPLSGRPYVLSQEEDDTVIRCPNPAEHGLKALWVSLRFPAPTAEKGEGD